VKYMLLIYGNEETWSSFTEDDMTRAVTDTETWHDGLRRSGEFIGAYGMADPVMTRLVQLRNGAPVVTDGPYLEAKEYLGSFTLVDCEGLDRALEIAAQDPFAGIGTVEVWPIMHEAPEA
jgi:hypothetical protein